MEEAIDRVKIGQDSAAFRDTTSGYISQDDKGQIAEGDDGWIDGGTVYAFINGTN